jgi:hypothetical protein
MASNARIGATSLQYLSKDPSAILADIITKAQAVGSSIVLGGTIGGYPTVASTGTLASYQFNTVTYREAIDKILELCPVGWYTRIDGDGIIYLQDSTTATPTHPHCTLHYLSLGGDVIEYEPEKRTESIVNAVYFTGGKSSLTGKSVYKRFVRQGSIDTYGEYSKRISDGRVTREDTMATIAERILDTYEQPEVRITAKVLNSVALPNTTGTPKIGYKTATLRVGDTVKFLNNTSKGSTKWDEGIWDVDVWDYDVTNTAAQPLQIQKVTYHPDYAIIEVSNRQPNIAKRIEDINRNLVDSVTANNPAIPD